MLPLVMLACWLAFPAASQRIEVLQGERAIHNIAARSFVPVRIRVVGPGDQPLAGVVTFTAPRSGPSASFDGAGLDFITTTGPDGEAATIGFRPNRTAGTWQLRVTAVAGASPVTVLIPQTNAAPSEASSKRRRPPLLWIGVIAGSGALAALIPRKSAPATIAPSVSVPAVATPPRAVAAVTPGAGTIGAP